MDTRRQLLRALKTRYQAASKAVKTRLGITLQLTTARFLGAFINDAMQVSAGVRNYVAL